MCAITYATTAALPEAKMNVIASWANLFTCLHLLPLWMCPKTVPIVWIGMLRLPAAPGATQAIIEMTADLGTSGKSRQARGAGPVGPCRHQVRAALEGDRRAGKTVPVAS